MTKKKLNLILAEDHELTRIGLAHALQRNALINILGEAENGKQTIDMVKRLQPDVVLMDIGMPEMDGIEATRHIKQLYPEIKIVILSSRQEKEEVYASLSSGADAYCLKDIKVDRLIQALEMVSEGGTWLDPLIASMVIDALPDITQKANFMKEQLFQANLTDRELEVLKEICSGKSNKEIALALKISLYTVKAHVCNIIQKLSVDDRTQAAIKAIQAGLF